MQTRPTDGVVREAWTFVRAHWLGLAPIVVVMLAFTWLAQDWVVVRLGSVALVLVELVGLAAYLWLQGALAAAVHDARLHAGALSLRRALRLAHQRVPALLKLSVVAAVAIGASVVVPLLALSRVGFESRWVLVPVLVAPLTLAVLWSLAAPSIVAEDLGPLRALRRSRGLVRGYGGSVLVAYVVALLLPMLMLFPIAAVAASMPPTSGAIAIDAIRLLLVQPFLALVATLLFYRLRDAHAAAEAPAETPPPSPAWHQPGPKSTLEWPSAYKS